MATVEGSAMRSGAPPSPFTIRQSQLLANAVVLGNVEVSRTPRASYQLLTTSSQATPSWSVSRFSIPRRARAGKLPVHRDRPHDHTGRLTLLCPATRYTDWGRRGLPSALP